MVTCPRCGNQVSDNAAFCPKCGQKLDAQPESRPPSMGTSPSPSRKERQGCGLSLAVILTALVVALAIIVIGIGAFYMGLNDRSTTERDMAAEHFDKGYAYLHEGQLDLAVAELDRAVQLDPEHQEAQELLADAQRQLEAQPTATPVLGPETKQAYFAEIQAAYDQGNWAHVVDTADRLISLDPAYERAQVDEMVIASFVAQGQQAAGGGQIGDALAMFDRALVLDPANAQALRERELASLYASALAAWNSNWPAAIESLDALYSTAPSYLDVEDRLHDAYVAHGESLALQEHWCEAAGAFAAAMDVRLSSQVVTQHQEATAKCQAISGTLDGQAGENPAATPPGSRPAVPSGPSGTYVGRVAETEHLGGTSVFCRGHVYDRSGQAVVGTRVQIQAWDWSAKAITDAEGQYSFDGLGNPVTYTLSLLDLPSQPFDVGLQEGIMTWVDFNQAP